MKTDDLITRLAADPAPRRLAPGAALALAVLAAGIAVALAFFALVGPRPDFAVALQTWRFDAKFVVTIGLAVSALLVLREALYPEGRPNLWLLLTAPALLAVAVVFELVSLPPAAWGMAAIGKNSLLCLTIVPGLAIAPLIMLVAAVRQGAPAQPGWAGFAAGLLAGGLSATFYAANCTDDSPLFVLTWYPIAIVGLGLVGAAIGRLAARW